jgi:hypothetical protein
MAAYDSLTTRMPKGLTNADSRQIMGAAGTPDPTWSQMYCEDFNTFAPGDYTNTTVGTGTATLIPWDGGAIALATSAGAADSVYLQLVSASYKNTAGRAMFFKFKGQLSEVINCVFHAGLMATDTTPQDDPNGIYIRKPTGAATLQLVITVGGVPAVYPFPTSLLLTAATDFEVGFMVDYLGNVAGFYNPGTGPKQQNTPNIPDGRVVSAVAPSLPTALLAPSMGLLNSTAAARTLTADFIVASRER